jgi:phosphate starvation-inducible PhoH-like protein
LSLDDHFTPHEPQHLRELAGPENRWLGLIESGFGVNIECPGGEMVIGGEAVGRAAALATLRSLEERLKRGFAVEEGAVRAAIAFVRAGSEPAEGGIVIPRRNAIGPRTPMQARYVDALKSCDLTFGVGPAGTGKTYLAVAYGASLLLQGRVERLIVTRPAVEAGEKLGFLPGALEEKVDPYLAPIWDCLRDVLGRDQMQRRKAAGDIEIAPLAFMRGRTLSNAFVVVDEAQNTTRMQMKMLLTRIGFGARMAVTGDPSQIDLPSAQPSGLIEALEILTDVEGVGIVRFTRDDVVRHPLVGRIVAAYETKGR